MRNSQYDLLDLTPLTHSLAKWLDGGSGGPHIGPELGAYIRIHRLSALLYHIGASLGEHLEQRAHAKWTTNTQNYLARMIALKDAWSNVTPTPVLIKGADYNENIYGDPGARSAVDLDMLVSRSMVCHIKDQIQSDRTRPQRDSDSIAYEKEGALLEIHSTIGPDFFVEDVTEQIIHRSMPSVLDGLNVRFPCPEHRLIIWLANQAKSAFIDGLWSLVDLALILRPLVAGQPASEWQRLSDRIRSYGLERAFEMALLKLDHSGIWPFDFPLEHSVKCRLLDRLTLEKHSPCIAPSLIQRQALKLWLCRSKHKVSYITLQGKSLRRRVWQAF